MWLHSARALVSSGLEMSAFFRENCRVKSQSRAYFPKPHNDAAASRVFAPSTLPALSRSELLRSCAGMAYEPACPAKACMGSLRCHATLCCAREGHP